MKEKFEFYEGTCFQRLLLSSDLDVFTYFEGFLEREAVVIVVNSEDSGEAFHTASDAIGTVSCLVEVFKV